MVPGARGEVGLSGGGTSGPWRERCPSPGGLCVTQGGTCEQRPRGQGHLPSDLGGSGSLHPSRHVCGMTLTSSTLLRGRRRGGSEVPGQWPTAMTCGPGLAAAGSTAEAGGTFPWRRT